MEQVSQFDYSNDNRESTIRTLFERARDQRGEYDLKCKTLDNAYKVWTKTMDKYKNLVNDGSFETYGDPDDGISSLKLSDPYVQVESQVMATPPEPMFSGREQGRHSKDSEKAKQREYAVKYILYKNDIKSKNSKSERFIRKYGDSIWKVYFDDSISYDDTNKGDIVVDCINLDDFFPDPEASRLEDCEYVDYVYYVHKRKAERLWGKELKKHDIDIWDIGNATPESTQSIERKEKTDNTVQILEHWYKDEDGDICLSMLCNLKEFRHVKKYWQNTHIQNKNYPFAHLWSIYDETSFWNISELEVIMPLCDCQDEVLNMGIDNFRRMGNDSIIYESGCLADGQEITNEAGEIIEVNQGQINNIRRLGGLQGVQEVAPTIQFLQEQIQRTTRNYDTNLGKADSSVKTASGQNMLRMDASTQADKKNFDVMQGWKRLFELIDWALLEFYDEPRHIFIGTPKAERRNTYNAPEEVLNPMMNLDKTAGDIYFTYNSTDMKEERQMSEKDRQMGMPNEYYYPAVDCEVQATNGIEKSKSFVVETLQAVMKMQITIDNYKVAIMLMRELGIPESEDIINQWLDTFEPEQVEGIDPNIAAHITPQQKQMFKQNPEMVEMAKQLSKQNVRPQGTTNTMSQGKA